MPRPLDGIKVIDLTRMLVGPTATMLLADMGADVVKVEPNAGDDTRYQQLRHAPEACPFFLALNRNKRDIVLDLSDSSGRDVLLRLVSTADIVVHNFRPGVVEKLRITYQDLRAVRPDLIYCSISAFGETGPYSKRPGTDVLFQAMSGLMSITGEPDGTPMRAAAPMIDVTTGVTAAFAITNALLLRMKTGEGSYVQTDLFSQAVFMQAPMMAWAAAESANPPRLGNRSPMALIIDVRTSDGYLMLAIPSPKFWKILCESIERLDLAKDPRFKSHSLRLQNQAALMELIEPAFLKQSTADWQEKLIASGVPCGPVRTYREVLDDPQLVANGMFLDMDHEVAGRAKVVGLPFRIGEITAVVDRSAPTLGQDTESILREAGYDDSAIIDLAARGVTTARYASDEGAGT